MSIQARSKATKKKPGRKAPRPGTTPVARRLLAQANREEAEGKPPEPTPAKSPAQFIAEQDALASAALHRGVGIDYDANKAAEQSIAQMPVPVPFELVCAVIGVDCKETDFAPTALMELSRQIDVVADIAQEDSATSGYECWKFVRNISDRAQLAGRVAAWLQESGPAAELPEVQP